MTDATKVRLWKMAGDGALIAFAVFVLAALAHAQVPQSPERIQDGTKTCGAVAAEIAGVSAGFAIRLQNNDATETVIYGDATPVLELRPLSETSFNVSDLTTVYCKRGGSVDVDVEWAVLTP